MVRQHLYFVCDSFFLLLSFCLLLRVMLNPEIIFSILQVYLLPRTLFLVNNRALSLLIFSQRRIPTGGINNSNFWVYLLLGIVLDLHFNGSVLCLVSSLKTHLHLLAIRYQLCIFRQVMLLHLFFLLLFLLIFWKCIFKLAYINNMRGIHCNNFIWKYIYILWISIPPLLISIKPP
jgi:hypothetical protein